MPPPTKISDDVGESVSPEPTDVASLRARITELEAQLADLKDVLSRIHGLSYPRPSDYADYPDDI